MPGAMQLHAPRRNAPPCHALAPTRAPGEGGYDPSTLHVPAAALSGMTEFNKQVSLVCTSTMPGLFGLMPAALEHPCHVAALLGRFVSQLAVLVDQGRCNGPGPFRAPRQVRIDTQRRGLGYVMGSAAHPKTASLRCAASVHSCHDAVARSFYNLFDLDADIGMRVGLNLSGRWGRDLGLSCMQTGFWGRTPLP